MFIYVFLYVFVFLNRFLCTTNHLNFKTMCNRFAQVSGSEVVGNMPADGDALLARVTAGPGAGDAAGLGAAAAAYFGRVAALRKTGKAGQAFSADDARKEGGVLVKLFSAAIKQQVCGPGPRAPRPAPGCRRGSSGL